jgi:hypothetical protein
MRHSPISAVSIYNRSLRERNVFCSSKCLFAILLQTIDIPRPTQYLRQILRKSGMSTHMVRYTRDSRWNPKSNILQPDKAATWPPRRLSYRPAVFSRHLPPTAFLFPARKNSARVKICVISTFYTFQKLS